MFTKPNLQLTTIGVGGAVAIILVWVLSLFKVEMPMEVATAVPVVFAWIVGYFTPEKNSTS